MQMKIPSNIIENEPIFIKLSDLLNEFFPDFGGIKINSSDFSKSVNFEIKKLIDAVNLPMTIDAAIMVKNQQEYIKKAIDSAMPLVDRIIIMDTGSTDATMSIVRNYKSEKISIYEAEWVENYSYMRNELISHVNNDWILIIDSDETIPISCDISDLKILLNYFGYLYKSEDIRIRVEAHYSDTEKFVLPDRLLKNTPSISFKGMVHEEPISKKNQIVTLKSAIRILNIGNEPKQIQKFDKQKRYTKLLKKMLQLEPENPRWIALSEKNILSEIYPDISDKNLIKKYLLKDSSKNISIGNLKYNDFTQFFLEKLVVEYMAEGDFESGNELIRLGLEYKPNDINFLMFKYFSKIELHDRELHDLIKLLIFDIRQLDTPEARFVSQKSVECLYSIIVKILMGEGNYTTAKKYASNISDGYSLSLISDELKFFGSK